jgi:glycosyltransferase involved in cell wall biosynthesis
LKKVWIVPQFKQPDVADGGIRRVSEAQVKHLPAYGWEVTEDPYAADVLNCHAGNYADLHINKPWVASSHGLYWTAEMEFGDWARPANAHVLVNLRRADLLTAPSEWVAASMRRGLCSPVTVIGHGIDPDEWEPGESQGYVLWNKARADVVCDPREMNRLAAMEPGVVFISTFGEPRNNVEITGQMPYPRMQELVRNAGVYLCLARETFGIGTLEAMAAAVPVLGWAHGGQLDILKHGEHGWLAKPGDYESLHQGLRYCLDNRAELGAAAREHVLEHYKWADVIGQYAAVYERALSEWETQRRQPRTSVVVTCYNLAQYLPECLDSILAQQDADWECLIVDDCSPDNTAEVAQQYVARDPRIRYVRTPSNLYLAGARNYGIRASTGRYILPLDADDMLTPTALQTLADGLDKDRRADIAYGHMEYFQDAPLGQRQMQRGGWPEAFRMERQMRQFNQLPYSSMYRRRVWERVGGYREHIRTAEDADFWCRVTSYGFRPAKVTEAPYLVKRERQDSMGRVEPVSRDWTEWFPWARDKLVAPYGALAPSTEKVDRFSYLVRSHANPVVSVVIPVGPGHEQRVIKAIDSVVAQTEPDWECVVVDDTGKDLTLPGFPFARLVRTEHAASGAGAARNAGVVASKGQFLVFLDADDWLHPEFVRKALSVWRQGQSDRHEVKEYVFTDFMKREGDKRVRHHCPDINGEDNLRHSHHPVTTLLPRDAWLLVGGFDEAMPGWEDWDFYIAVCAAGWCPVHLAEPLVQYDMWSGERRDTSLVNHFEQLKQHILAKWADYHSGAKKMACGACNKKTRAATVPAPTTNQVQASAPANGNGAVSAEFVESLVMVEYLSLNRGAHHIYGPATHTFYGRRGGGDRFMVHPADLAAAPNWFRRA